MVRFTYEGWEKIINLIDKGKRLEDIVDSNGRSIDSDAEEFTLHHKQIKRVIIKHLINNHYDRDRMIKEVFRK